MEGCLAVALCLSNSYLVDRVLNDGITIDMDHKQRIDRIRSGSHHRLDVVHDRSTNGLFHFEFTIVLEQF